MIPKPTPGCTSSGSIKPDDIVAGIEEYISKEILAAYNDAEDLDEQDCILSHIIDLMNDIAPKYHYFGVHEGDGACFGFWKYGKL